MTNKNGTGSIAARPCKKRKDGAPSVPERKEKAQGWATRSHCGPCEDRSLTYLLTTQLLLLSSVAFAADRPASCELVGKTVVSRSSSGLAQVSNLGDIQITCSVPARPYSRGDSRSPLKIATVAYQILPHGSKKLVPSETKQTGGSYGTEAESVYFNFHIPLEPAERDAEANLFVAKLEKSIPPEQITGEVHQKALERVREFVYQHRVGHFQVECRILDGDRLMGVALVELEVLFKGRFSDAGLPGFSPA